MEVKSFPTQKAVVKLVRCTVLHRTLVFIKDVERMHFLCRVKWNVSISFLFFFTLLV